MEEIVEEMSVRFKEEEEAYYEKNPKPWHSLLMHPSHASWRSSPLPETLDLFQRDILKESDRTGRQLRRTYDRIITSHRALAEKRERERRHMVNHNNT